MLRKLFNYIADSLAWEMDLQKTSPHAFDGFLGDSVDRNVYYKNLRTGDRKIAISFNSLTPPDYNWLAETKKTGIVDDALFGITKYTKAELQALAANSKNKSNRQPRP